MCSLIYDLSQAQARPGMLILDPFVGTGGLLIPCSHFGAQTIGADIDIRTLRGKGLVCYVFFLKNEFVFRFKKEYLFKFRAVFSSPSRSCAL